MFKTNKASGDATKRRDEADNPDRDGVIYAFADFGDNDRSVTWITKIVRAFLVLIGRMPKR